MNKQQNKNRHQKKRRHYQYKIRIIDMIDDKSKQVLNQIKLKLQREQHETNQS